MCFNQLKVNLCSFWGTDQNIAHNAWASSNDVEALQLKTEKDVERVVKFVTNHEHDTPKERVWMEFFVRCPIFVERQFDKYRMTTQYQDFQIEYLHGNFAREGITQNELSGRYRTIPNRPYETPHDVSAILEKCFSDDEYNEISAKEVDEFLERQHIFYQCLLNGLKAKEKDGIISNAEYKRSREVLRGVLGTSYLTDMKIIMNLNAFEHIINQRLAEAAQMESRIIAYSMVQEVLHNNIANVAVSTMIQKNGWDVLMEEVRSFVSSDPQI